MGLPSSSSLATRHNPSEFGFCSRCSFGPFCHLLVSLCGIALDENGVCPKCGYKKQWSHRLVWHEERVGQYVGSPLLLRGTVNALEEEADDRSFKLAFCTLGKQRYSLPFFITKRVTSLIKVGSINSLCQIFDLSMSAECQYLNIIYSLYLTTFFLLKMTMPLPAGLLRARPERS